MSIPFGAILVAAGEALESPRGFSRSLAPCNSGPSDVVAHFAGLVGAFTGFGSAASLHIAGLGALSMVVSSVSLARWKVNESSLPFTAANAIIRRVTSCCAG